MKASARLIFQVTAVSEIGIVATKMMIMQSVRSVIESVWRECESERKHWHILPRTVRYRSSNVPRHIEILSSVGSETGVYRQLVLTGPFGSLDESAFRWSSSTEGHEINTENDKNREFCTPSENCWLTVRSEY